jgi:hypothetical protein
VEAVSDACISFSLDSLYLTQAGELVLSGIYPKAQVGLLSLGGLSELTFNAMSFESPDALVGILRSFPRLRTVRFTHCILLPHHNTSRSEATAYLLPNLEALEILNTTAGVILSVFIPVPTLSTLRLKWLDDVRHIPHVEDIMRASEQSLTTVSLWLGSPGQDETIGMFLLPRHLPIPLYQYWIQVSSFARLIYPVSWSYVPLNSLWVRVTKLLSSYWFCYLKLHPRSWMSHCTYGMCLALMKHFGQPYQIFLSGNILRICKSFSSMATEPEPTLFGNSSRGVRLEVYCNSPQSNC